MVSNLLLCDEAKHHLPSYPKLPLHALRKKNDIYRLMIIALHVILTFLMPEFGWLWLAMNAVISAIALFSSTEVTSCAEAIIRTVQSSKHRVKRVIFIATRLFSLCFSPV